MSVSAVRSRYILFLFSLYTFSRSSVVYRQISVSLSRSYAINSGFVKVLVHMYTVWYGSLVEKLTRILFVFVYAFCIFPCRRFIQIVRYTLFSIVLSVFWSFSILPQSPVDLLQHPNFLAICSSCIYETSVELYIFYVCAHTLVRRRLETLKQTIHRSWRFHKCAIPFVYKSSDEMESIFGFVHIKLIATHNQNHLTMTEVANSHRESLVSY